MGQNTSCTWCVQWILSPDRLGGADGERDDGRPPVGGLFRQQDRTPFFLLTPAFGLRSLRKNGYVPNWAVTVSTVRCDKKAVFFKSLTVVIVSNHSDGLQPERTLHTLCIIDFQQSLGRYSESA